MCGTTRVDRPGRHIHGISSHRRRYRGSHDPTPFESNGHTCRVVAHAGVLTSCIGGIDDDGNVYRPRADGTLGGGHGGAGMSGGTSGTVTTSVGTRRNESGRRYGGEAGDPVSQHRQRGRRFRWSESGSVGARAAAATASLARRRRWRGPRNWRRSRQGGCRCLLRRFGCRPGRTSGSDGGNAKDGAAGRDAGGVGGGSADAELAAPHFEDARGGVAQLRQLPLVAKNYSTLTTHRVTQCGGNMLAKADDTTQQRRPSARSRTIRNLLDAARVPARKRPAFPTPTSRRSPSESKPARPTIESPRPSARLEPLPELIESSGTLSAPPTSFAPGTDIARRAARRRAPADVAATPGEGGLAALTTAHSLAHAALHDRRRHAIRRQDHNRRPRRAQRRTRGHAQHLVHLRP